MPRKKNPWKRLLKNVMLSATYGSAGARNETNPKFSGRAYHRNAACSSQSTRRHNVEITKEDLEALFHKQEGKCFWFGITLNPLDIYRIRYPLAMSVDRLNNKLGYIKGNIIICCRMANLGRQSCSVEEYGEIIKVLKKTFRKKKVLAKCRKVRYSRKSGRKTCRKKNAKK